MFRRVLTLAPVSLLVLLLMPAAPAAAVTSGALIPTVDCVTYSAADDTLTATFGYINTTGSTVLVNYGGNNVFLQAPNIRGQLTTFLPGTNHGAFTSAPFPASDVLTWRLLNGEATASNDPSTYCVQPVEADSSLAMPSSVTTTPGIDVGLTSTVVDPLAPPSGNYGTVLYSLGSGLAAGTLPAGSPCTTDPGTPWLISCPVSAGADNGIAVRAATPGAYTVTGTFLPSREGDATSSNNVATTAVLVTDAPTVVPGPASSVTADGAVLNGTVNPAGAATTAAFSYWPEGHSDQAADAPTAAPGDGFAVVPLTATLTGLLPGTTYDYALAATDATGTTTGSTGSFTTLAAAPPVTSADLSVAMTAPATGRVGRASTFTVTVTNAGPDAADGAVLTLLTSTPTTTRWLTTTLGSCSSAAPGCTLGNIPAGGSVKVVGSVVPKIAGPLALVATVGASTADPAPRNDTAVRGLTIARR